MGEGTKENPYTREDVLTLIEKRGGMTEGLNLSEKWFEKGIKLLGIDANRLPAITLKGVDLRRANLEGADLTGAKLEGAILWEANLEGANLGFANLKGVNLSVANMKRCYLANAILQGADLQEAHLEQANLFQANLEGANFWQAHLDDAILVQTNLNEANLEGACLKRANLVWAQYSSDTKFDGADWGDYILGEERKKDFGLAEQSYRRLRHWHTSAGLYDIAGKFFYREMEAKRKSHSWKREFKSKFWSSIVRLLCGYGEKYENVVVSALVIIFGSAIAYRFGGLDLASSMYFSLVSFTAVGYGGWVSVPAGWIKWLGVTETILGVFMMSLFLVTFTRKMTR